MQFYTIKQGAGMLAVSERTVRRWIKARKLVAHPFGGAVRIAEGDLKPARSRPGAHRRLGHRALRG